MSGGYREGLNSKVKLALYETFGKEVLGGMCDAGTRLLFKFRSGTRGLNEELGRHRGREGRNKCMLCGYECKSVSHVLLKCPAYSSIRANLVMQLQASLGGNYSRFEARSSFEKSSFILEN